MDKQQAEKALGIIRQVIENTREDLVAHNWGTIWLVHAFTNGAAFASIGPLVEAHKLAVYWYLVPLAVVAAVNLVVVTLLMNRERGVRSFIEWQIHGIWTTFIVFSLAGAAVLHVGGASPMLFGPLMAVTSGIGFAMMGVVFYQSFFTAAAVFLALAVAIAMPQVAPFQWYLIGLAWWGAMFVPGAIMFREKRRRQIEQRETKIL